MNALTIVVFNYFTKVISHDMKKTGRRVKPIEVRRHLIPP